jgi:CheY-like chemotaxis protein
MENAPIVIIDDDIEDLDLLREMAHEIGMNNQIMAFHDPEEALDFLQSTIIQPHFILCDINMPRMNGFQLRTALLAIDSAIKEVPFLFLSTSRSPKETVFASDLKVTGYYIKSNSFAGMKEILQSIMTLLKISPGS